MAFLAASRDPSVRIFAPVIRQLQMTCRDLVLMAGITAPLTRAGNPLGLGAEGHRHASLSVKMESRPLKVAAKRKPPVGDQPGGLVRRAIGIE